MAVTADGGDGWRFFGLRRCPDASDTDDSSTTDPSESSDPVSERAPQPTPVNAETAPAKSGIMGLGSAQPHAFVMMATLDRPAGSMATSPGESFTLPSARDAQWRGNDATLGSVESTPCRLSWSKSSIYHTNRPLRESFSFYRMASPPADYGEGVRQIYIRDGGKDILSHSAPNEIRSAEGSELSGDPEPQTNAVRYIA